MNTRPQNKTPAPCIAFLGTGSDVGKSFVVAAACNAFKQAGWDVAPYKAQNMSNNSYVTEAGLEMGRAQVVQAEAAGLTPHVDMNPVLLKPSGDTSSQVVVQGIARGERDAREYFQNGRSLFAEAMQSLDRLRAKHALILMEGAGSCAEVNLRDRDIVNFPAAHHADAAVILVADIERGGVFGQVVGSLAVMRPEDRARVKGILINRFRGDVRLFEDGVRWLEEETGLPILGVLPYDRSLILEEEDGLQADAQIDPLLPSPSDTLRIAVPLLPRMSNHTDFDPLIHAPRVGFHYLSRPRPLSSYHLVLLPGSKNTRMDLDWLKEAGWVEYLADYRTRGGHLGGICGGYQMLGQAIHDPQGVEGEPGSSSGLGFLDVESTLQPGKQLTQSRGIWAGTDWPVEGFEIHMGISTPTQPNSAPRLTQLQRTPDSGNTTTDGCVSADGKVWGTYLHGLFDSGVFTTALLRALAPDYKGRVPDTKPQKASRYDALGSFFRQHVDFEKLIRLITS